MVVKINSKPMSAGKRAEIRKKMRAKISKEKYQSIFGKDGNLDVFLGKIHGLTENMEKYNDINDSPLKTLEKLVIEIVEFKRDNARLMEYLKKYLANPIKHAKVQSLVTIVKEWLPMNGIRYNAGSVGKGEKIGSLVTINFYDRSRTVLRLEAFEYEIQKFKNSQVKHGLNPADRMLDEEVSIAYYKLKPMVNQIRLAMTSMVSELKKLQHTPKKRFSLFR